EMVPALLEHIQASLQEIDHEVGVGVKNPRN
ncbi:hypothetical protein LCGC14_2181410, partial [marine sediment metagenome]